MPTINQLIESDKKYNKYLNEIFKESTKKFKKTLENYYKSSDKEKEFEKAIDILEEKIKKLKEKKNEKVQSEQHKC